MNKPTGSILLCSALFCAAFLLLCTVSSAQAPAASSRAAAVLDSMPHAKGIDQVAISPDGTQVAYIVDGELSVTSATGGAAHRVAVGGNLPLRDVTWSAD